LLALYVFEASAVVAVLAFNRYYNLLDTLAVRQLAMVATPLVLALVSGAYVVVNLIVDMLYTVLDPRIRY